MHIVKLKERMIYEHIDMSSQWNEMKASLCIEIFILNLNDPIRKRDL